MDKLFELYFKLFPLRIMKYHNYRVEKFIREMAIKYDKKGVRILDMGAESSPYRKYFANAKYFTQDITQNNKRNIDFIGDLNGTIAGIKSCSFDNILCTQVLEHIKEPANAFREFHRILKKGGRLFLTTHMCYDEHMVPYDYFRFTKFGLRHLGESNGLRVISIKPQGGIFIVITRIINTLIPKLLPKNKLLYYSYYVLSTLPILVINSFLLLLDNLDRQKSMTLNYECIFSKK